MMDAESFVSMLLKSIREESLPIADMELTETDSKIHEIYEQYTNSREFNNTLMHDDIDIDWLKGKLDIENFRKLEDYILQYGSRHDELIFRLGFKYAWSLFHECMEKEK